MCGITGFLRRAGDRSGERLRGDVRTMADAIRHRGPDAGGEWCDTETGLALGFRRLAILDLAPTGDQPMLSADGRYVVVFNGEIYNFTELRRELEGRGHSFRGRSDTEVMLTAASAWGVRAMLERIEGMFALALWDRQTRTLTLARDRIGIKPLYYGRSGGDFLFASELKACVRYPGFGGEVDPQAVVQFLHYGYVSCPYCIYAGMHKLPPGGVLTLTAGAMEGKVERYWRLEEVMAHGHGPAAGGAEPETADELDRLLRRAVARHMVADVPVGAFLSGGIDSSTVVALMQQVGSKPARTFSIGFREPAYNEADHARVVAEHLGTDHTELYLEPSDALAAIPELPQIYDEPFADSSQIPTLLVSRLAREAVTVALSGDGGDELFGGYNRYLAAPRVWDRLRLLPAPVRHALAQGLRALPPGGRRLAATIGRRLHGMGAGGNDWERHFAKALRVLDAPTRLDLYNHICMLGGAGARLAAHPLPAVTPAPTSADYDYLTEMQYLDLLTYLPDDILVKVDRASMAVSLEARVPLLDDRVIAFAATLPPAARIVAGRSKAPLRNVLERYVPRALTERPKSGFAVPVGDWLRGPLRDWAEPLLRADLGLVDGGMVDTLWRRHLAGDALQDELWAVLMLQAWAQPPRRVAAPAHA